MSIDVTTAKREELVSYISGLKHQLSNLNTRLSQSESKLGNLNTKLTQTERELTREKEISAWLRRQVFGQKSERIIPQDPRQSTIFEVPETPPAKSTSIKSYERAVRTNPTEAIDENPLRFDESVPVEEEVILPAEVKGLSKDKYEIIGEKVTNRLIQVPAQYRVKRTIRKTVKLKASQTLHTAPAPEAVIERSFADASLLAGMITDKFQYHLPLYTANDLNFGESSKLSS